MIKLVNKITGTDMWVDENRVDRYIAAGHKPAAMAKEAKEPEKTVKETAEEKPVEEKPKKAIKKK